MQKDRRQSPTESSLLFEIDPEPAKESITVFGGIPLVVHTCRALGLARSVKDNIRVKERERGFDEATLVESFIVLNATGADKIDDFDHLREDQGLQELIGHKLPSSSVARQFLYAFHEEEKIEEAKQRRLPDEIAYIPEESERLTGLGKVNQDLVIEFGRRVPDEKIATVDQDATIMKSRKQEALPTYKGGKGYQPMLAMWAETEMILADEFRDGNVPSMMEPLTVAKRAFACLPPTVEEFYFRGDSACHESHLLNWLRDDKREQGPKCRIGFAISAKMSEALKAAIKQVGKKDWHVYGDQSDDVVRECADVVFVSEQEAKNRDSQPLRYVAIRIQKKQGELFADGSSVKHFAIVSNIWEWEAEKLIDWHREKAGTIEHVNDVIKNELAAGVMPCSRFGANAAWLRLAVISHNVITALKRLGLPKDLKTARPKRLRFLIFNTAGRVVHHARQIILRLCTTQQRLKAYWLDAIAAIAVAT
jgi:hypothetical protein